QATRATLPEPGFSTTTATARSLPSWPFTLYGRMPPPMTMSSSASSSAAAAPTRTAGVALAGSSAAGRAGRHARATSAAGRQRQKGRVTGQAPVRCEQQVGCRDGGLNNRNQCGPAAEGGQQLPPSGDRWGITSLARAEKPRTIGLAPLRGDL